MDGGRPAGRRGSSFGGPRRGTDPEGGERSAWKGLCGPSGLNLDHSRIPDIQRTVYEHLVPLVVAAADPLPLSQFTQKCCDVLLPVLEKERELGAHAFKSQFGRLNEFVCPELARRAGLADSGFNREAKTVRLYLQMASSSSPAGQQRAAASPPAHTAAAPPAAAAAPTPAATAAPTATVYWTPAGAAEGPVSPAGPQPVAPGLPLPVALPQGPVGQLRAPPVVAPLPAVAPALCAYCHAPHSMRECREFHAMLQALYQAGYQRGLATAQPAAPTPGSTGGGS